MGGSLHGCSQDVHKTSVAAPWASGTWQACALRLQAWPHSSHQPYSGGLVWVKTPWTG